MLEVRQTDRYRRWFAGLHAPKARARIDMRIRRLALGNPGDAKSVGGGAAKCASFMVQDTGYTSCGAERFW